MVDWLARRFVPGYDDPGDPAVRARVGQFAGAVCIVLNLCLCAAKGAIGLIAGSVSIVADALNNLSDASSNIVSLLGFKLASRPADPEHPYGHGRFEYLAGLVVAVLVCVVGIELVQSSFQKVLHPEPVEFSAAVAAVLLLSILVKFWMAAFNRCLGERISSETLPTAQQAASVIPECRRWVRAKGLEPSRESRQDLNLVRLPIPPRPRIVTAFA